MSRTVTKSARRADARHNLEKIVEAAITSLARDPDASVIEIARAAGVGRVTLYGHFPSRDALIEAALTRLLHDGDEVLGELDLTGDPREALRGLIASSWLLIAQSSAVLEAAQSSLPPALVRDLHAKPEQRVGELIARGQAEGVFREDLPADWLASALHHIIKGAATDVAGGRLDRSDAPRLIAETILGAYAPVARG